MADSVVVVDRNPAVAVFLSLIAAAAIAFALWFFVFDGNDQNDDGVPDVTVTTVAN